MLGLLAPLAEFDEALAVQGFYSRVQRERSDKALDAFDQRLREPLDCPNWMPSGWHASRCSPNATTTHQSELQMDSTANASKPNSQKSGNELIEEVVSRLGLEPSTILDDRVTRS